MTYAAASPKTVLCAITAQQIRAILLAKATVVRRADFAWRSFLTQFINGPSVVRLEKPTTAVAPMTSKVLKYRFPAFVIRPNRSLPPDELIAASGRAMRQGLVPI